MMWLFTRTVDATTEKILH